MSRAGAVLLVLALVLAAAGCGGEKHAETTTTTQPAATTTSAAATASLLTTITALMSCPQLSPLESSLVSTLTGSGGNVKQEIAAIKREAAKTPKPVRPDFMTIANALGDATDALKGVDFKHANSGTVTKLMGSLQSPDVQRAAANIDRWAQKN